MKKILAKVLHTYIIGLILSLLVIMAIMSYDCEVNAKDKWHLIKQNAEMNYAFVLPDDAGTPYKGVVVPVCFFRSFTGSSEFSREAVIISTDKGSFAYTMAGKLLGTTEETGECGVWYHDGIYNVMPVERNKWGIQYRKYGEVIFFMRYDTLKYNLDPDVLKYLEDSTFYKNYEVEFKGNEVVVKKTYVFVYV